MPKTIFDYDSSGSDEEYTRPVGKDMYAYGTAILNHKSIAKAYKEGKKTLFQSTEHSKAITIALTQGTAGTEKFFLSAGSMLPIPEIT